MVEEVEHLLSRVPAGGGGSAGHRRVLVLQELSYHLETDASAGALHEGDVRGCWVVRANGRGRERSRERRVPPPGMTHERPAPLGGHPGGCVPTGKMGHLR